MKNYIYVLRFYYETDIYGYSPTAATTIAHISKISSEQKNSEKPFKSGNRYMIAYDPSFRQRDCVYDGGGTNEWPLNPINVERLRVQFGVT